MSSLYHYNSALKNIQICNIIILKQILTEKSLCLSLVWVCTYILPMPACMCAMLTAPLSVTFSWCRPAVLLLGGARAPHASDNDYYCG